MNEHSLIIENWPLPTARCLYSDAHHTLLNRPSPVRVYALDLVGWLALSLFEDEAIEGVEDAALIQRELRQLKREIKVRGQSASPKGVECQLRENPEESPIPVGFRPVFHCGAQRNRSGPNSTPRLIVPGDHAAARYNGHRPPSSRASSSTSARPRL